MNNNIQFGTLYEDGTLTNQRSLKQLSIGNCPFFIFLPEHYREDESCKCSNAEHRAMMIKEWGYSKTDFKDIQLIE